MTDLETRQSTVRRRFTAEQKIALVQATYEPGARVVEVARKYNVGVSVVPPFSQAANKRVLLANCRGV